MGKSQHISATGTVVNSCCRLRNDSTAERMIPTPGLHDFWPSTTSYWHRGIPCIPALFTPLIVALEQCPAQQSHGADDEAPDDDAVLDAVALEAHSRDVLFHRILANIEALPETERFRTLSAGRGTGGFRSQVVIVTRQEEGQGFG